ncbi:MAG: beta-propeller fold lactonase family protein [Pyrinomonadaceae bacterium]|nr:beta-propeller fold lactonase family protein [Pyrinomonadaceae bacterium]
MKRLISLLACCALLLPVCSTASSQQIPRPTADGYSLPNGWRLTPIGKAIPTEDMVLHLLPAPDGRAVIASHSGFNPHGLVVIDARTEQAVQRIPLKSTWLGMAWHPNGNLLYVSGGNADGRVSTRAPVYVFEYKNARLSPKPVATLEETIDAAQIYWSGLAHHPLKNILYAANRGTTPTPGSVVVFDTTSGKILARIPVGINPYDLALSRDGHTLYVSNWASDSVSVIDTDALKVVANIPVGDNPNDLELSNDERLFVACANDNSVNVIDTRARRAVEKISTALFPRAPVGSTPNALALDRVGKMLFVANADNNNVAVISVAKPGESEVLGFIPTGWYPSALAFGGGGQNLYVGNSKGLGSYSNIRGPHSRLPPGDEGRGSVKSLQKGSVNIVGLSNLKSEIKRLTRQVYENTPYNDDLLAEAKAPAAPSVIPRAVGAGSPVKHVLYIIKENRTYDQVLGDMPKGNGDSRLTIFGRKVTPNHHALAEQFVLFDNLYCDGEVSVDGHSWSNSAYATDFNEKLWPVTYGGHSKARPSAAHVPAGGHLWDLCRRKGLTYRSYGEYAARVSDGTTMDAAPGVEGLVGHVAPNYKKPGMRDTDNAAEFIREFDEYEKNYDSPDVDKRLPNFMVMSLPENHTFGATPDKPTPTACVANNDYALGLIVERVTHSKYWPETAIFVIEDDAQDGPDHVDARRTVAFAISPYITREKVDSTLYSTSSMLRTIELLLGLPPMSQYDAAATPMYAAFGTTADLTPYRHLKPLVNVDEKNTPLAWGAKESLEMDFSDVDLTPMFELNEIVWKSVRGAQSEMPLPVHRFRFASDPIASRSR